MATEIDYTALGLARAGVPLRGYGDTDTVYTGGDVLELYQTLRLRLDIYSESVVLTRYDKQQQPQACYEVAPAALAAALSGMPVTTGLLPENVLFYSRAGEERIGLYVPPGKRTLQMAAPAEKLIDGLAAITVPLPPLVFVGEGRTWAVYAVRERPTSAQDPLFHAPLPNVFTGDSVSGPRSGHICRGEVAMPACSLDTAHAALALFLESAFNDHLVDGKSQAHPDDVRELWQALVDADADAWPLDDLVQTDVQVGDLLGGVA